MGRDARLTADERARAALAFGNAKAAAEEHASQQPDPSQHQLVDAWGFPILFGGQYVFRPQAGQVPVVVVDIKKDLRAMPAPPGTDAWIVTLSMQIPLRVFSRSPVPTLQFIAGPVNEHLVTLQGATRTETAPEGDAETAPAPAAGSLIQLTDLEK